MFSIMSDTAETRSADISGLTFRKGAAVARAARRSTLVDIAADAGVSVSAVSKVLNGRTDVAAGTRARIAGLLRQHGYRVASRLGFGVVDLLMASLHGPWAEELLRGTVEAAAQV